MATPPRDFREWMRQVERKLQQAIRSGNAGAVKALNIEAEKIRQEVAESSVDNRIPAAPVEFTFQTELRTNRNGMTDGYIHVDFTAVTRATNGTFISIDHYEFWGRDETNWSGTGTAPEWKRLTTSAQSQFTHGPVKDDSTWRFRVRAFAVTAPLPGEWSQETYVEVGHDTTPPPIPSPLTITAELGVMTLSWDGLAGNGAAQPADYKNSEIAFGPESSPTAILKQKMEGAGQIIITGLPYNTPYYARIRSVDHTGNTSAWSAIRTGQVTPLVSGDISGLDTTLQQQVDRAEAAETAAEAAAADAVAADGRAQQAAADAAAAQGNASSAEQAALDAQAEAAQAQSDAAAANAAAAQAAADAETARLAAAQAEADAEQSFQDLQTFMNSSGRVLYQEAEPAVEDQSPNNLWIKPSTGETFVWKTDDTTGTSSWIEVENSDYAQAAANAAAAQAAAETARDAASAAETQAANSATAASNAAADAATLEQQAAASKTAADAAAAEALASKTAAEAAEARATEAEAAASSAQAAADQSLSDLQTAIGESAQIVRQETAPTSDLQRDGVLWIKDSTGESFTWNNVDLEWQLVDNVRIAQMAFDADAAADRAEAAEANALAAQGEATTAKNTAATAQGNAEAAQAAAIAAEGRADAAEAEALAAQTAAETAQANALAAEQRADEAEASAAQSLSNLQTYMDTAGRIIRQEDEPTGDARNKNNLWIKDSTGQSFTFNELTSLWEEVENEAYAAAATAADAAADRAEAAEAAAVQAEADALAAQNAAIAAQGTASDLVAQADAAQAAAEAAQTAASNAAAAAAASEDRAVAAEGLAQSADNKADAAEAKALEAAGLAATKGTVYPQPEAPAGDPNGLWIDTDNGNTPHRFKDYGPSVAHDFETAHDFTQGNTSNFAVVEDVAAHSGTKVLRNGTGATYRVLHGTDVYPRDPRIIYSAWVKIQSGTYMAGVHFLGSTGTNGYQVLLDGRGESQGAAQIRKDTGSGVVIKIPLTIGSAVPGEWYRVDAWADATKVYGRIYSAAGELIGSGAWSDASYASGTAGVYGYDQVWFDDFAVTAPAGEWLSVTDQNVVNAAQAADAARDAADAAEAAAVAARDDANTAAGTAATAQSNAEAAQAAAVAAEGRADTAEAAASAAQAAAVAAEGRADTAEQAAIDAAADANQSFNDLQTFMDKSGKTIYQEAVPATEDQNVNNLWIKPSDGSSWVWDANLLEWVEVVNEAVKAAALAADQSADAAVAAEAAAVQAEADALAAQSAAESAASTATTLESQAAAAQAAAEAAEQRAITAEANAAAAAADAEQSFADLQNTMANSGKIIYQDVEPTGDDRDPNNLWIKDSTGEVFAFSETEQIWKLVESDNIRQMALDADAAADRAEAARLAADNAETAATTAEGKATTAEAAAVAARNDATAAQSAAAAAESRATTAEANAEAAAADAEQSFNDLQGFLDNAGKIIHQEAEPAVEDRSINNLWIKDSTGEPHVWNPAANAGAGAWEIVTDQRVVQMAADADAAADEARAAEAAALAAQGEATTAKQNADAAAAEAAGSKTAADSAAAAANASQAAADAAKADADAAAAAAQASKEAADQAAVDAGQSSSEAVLAKQAAETAQAAADASAAEAEKALKSARTYQNSATSLERILVKQGLDPVVVDSPTAMGGKAVSKPGGSNLHGWWEDRGVVQAVDPNTLYRMFIRVRVITPTTEPDVRGDGFYWGAVGFADEEATVYVNNSGAHSYSSQQWAIQNSIPRKDGIWQDYVVYYKGISAGGPSGSGTLASPRTFQAATKFFCAGMILDYNNGNGNWEVSHWQVDAIDAVGHQAMLDAATAQTKANDAHELAGDADDTAKAALNAASHAGRNLFSTNDPSGTAPYGTIWIKHDATGKALGNWQQTGGSAPDPVTGLGGADGSTWTKRPVTSEMIDNLDVSKLTGLYIDAKHIQTSSLTIGGTTLGSKVDDYDSTKSTVDAVTDSSGNVVAGKVSGTLADSNIPTLEQSKVSGLTDDLSTIQGDITRVWKSARSYINEATSVEGIIAASGPAPTVIDSPTAVAGKAWQSHGSAYWIDTNGKLTFDPTALYRVKLRLRAMTGSSGNLYFGVCGWAADGTTYVNAVGANTTGQQHWVVNNQPVPVDEQWYDYEIFVSGNAIGNSTGGGDTPLAPKKLHENVRYIAPEWIVNYSGGTPPWEVSHVSMEAIDAAGAQALVDAELAKERLDAVTTGDGTVLDAAKVSGSLAEGNIPTLSQSKVSGLDTVASNASTAKSKVDAAIGPDNVVKTTAIPTLEQSKVSGLTTDLSTLTTAAAKAQSAAEAAMANAVNVVPDPSMEAGAFPAIDGWDIDTTVARSGSNSLRRVALPSGTSYANLAVGIPVQSGQTWRVTAWAMTTADYNGTAGNGKLRTARDGGTLMYADSWPNVQEWTKVERQFVVPTSMRTLDITLGADHTVGTLWLDDFSVTNVTEVLAAQSTANKAQERLDAVTDANGNVVAGKVAGELAEGNIPVLQQAKVSGLDTVASNASTAKQKVEAVTDASGNVVAGKVSGTLAEGNIPTLSQSKVSGLTTDLAALDNAAQAAMLAQATSENPSFEDWTGSLPVGYGAWSSYPTKETTYNRIGKNAVRFNVATASTQYGMTIQYVVEQLVPTEYVTVELDFMLRSGTLPGSGVIIDWLGGASGNRATLDLRYDVPDPVLNKWHRLTKTVKRPLSGTGVTTLSGYLMGNWSGFGAATKDLVYDWLNVRPATAQEIDAYNALAKIDAVTDSNGKVVAGQVAGTLAEGNIPTLGQSKVSGLDTVASNASTAKQKVEAVTDANGNVVAGKVTGELAQGNIPVIPTDKLLADSDTANLVDNPKFERGAAGWGGALLEHGVVRAITDGPIKANCNVAEITSDDGIIDIGNRNGIPAIEGDQFYVSVWVRKVVAEVTDQSVQFGTTVYRKDGSQTWPAISYAASTLPLNEWFNIKGTVIAPANSATIGIRLSMRNGLTGAVIQWSDVEFRRVARPETVAELPQDKVTGLPGVATDASTAKNKVEAVTDASGNVVAGKVSGELATGNIPELPLTKVGGTELDQFRDNSHNSVSIPSGGAGKWFRIAQNVGNRASAKFILKDTTSSQHMTATFEAGIMYSQQPFLLLQNFTKYSAQSFAKVRMLYKSTFDYVYLDVFINETSRTQSLEYFISDNVQESGWDAVDFTEAPAIPTGYTAKELVISEGNVIATIAGDAKGKVDNVTDTNGNVVAGKVAGELGTGNIPELPQDKVTGLPGVVTDVGTTKGRVEEWTATGTTFIEGGKIQTDSVKALQIDVNDFWADDANIGSVKAGHVDSDAIEGRHLKIGAVERENLGYVGVEEYLRDPKWLHPDTPFDMDGLLEFIDPVAGTTQPLTTTPPAGQGWQWDANAANLRFGQTRQLYYGGELGVGPEWQLFPVADLIQIEPGERYYIAIDTFSGSANFHVGLAMIYYDANGVRVGTGDSTDPHYAKTSSSYVYDRDRTWESHERVFTVPPGAIWGLPVIEAWNRRSAGVTTTGETVTGSSGYVLIGAMSFRRALAGTGSQQHAELSPAGLQLFNKEGNPVVNLTSMPPNFLGILDNGGDTLASMSDDGTVAAENLNVRNDPNLMGFPLFGTTTETAFPQNTAEGFMDYLPRGMVTRGYRSMASAPTATNQEREILELSYPRYKGRAYKIHITPIAAYIDSAYGYMKCYYTTDGSRPTMNSNLLQVKTVRNNSTDGTMVDMGTTWYDLAEAGTDHIRRYLFTYEALNGSMTFFGNARDGSQFRAWVEDIGLDVYETGIDRTGYRSNGGTSPSAPTTTEKQNYTKVWTATGSRSYYVSGSTYTYNTSKMYQGNSPAVGGLQSVATFPDMTGTLSGAEITDVRCYFYFNHWYNNSGGVARIHLHNDAGGANSTLADMTYAVSSYDWPKPGGRWVRIPSSFWAGIKNGTYKGVGLGDASPTLEEYGYANGLSTRIEVKYRK